MKLLNKLKIGKKKESEEKVEKVKRNETIKKQVYPNEKGAQRGQRNNE